MKLINTHIYTSGSDIIIIFIKKINSILTSKEVKGFIILLIGNLIMGLFEAISVVSIYPFMNVITNQNVIYESTWLNLIFYELKFTNVHSFIIFLGISTLFLLLLSNTVCSIVSWYTFNFVWNNNYSVSRRLLDLYLMQPYIFFVNKSSADVSKNVLNEVQQLTTGYMIPLIQAISGLIITIIICLTLLIVDPLATLFAVIIFGGIYFIIYSTFRKNLKSSGKERLIANKQRFKSVNEAFGAIKDVKLKNYEQYYLNFYSKSAEIYSNSMAKSTVISQVPRYILEGIAFGGIVILILGLYITYGDAGEIIPIVTVFTFAGYRLMPALHQVYTGITKVRFNQSTLENITNEFENINSRKSEKELDIDYSDRMGFEKRIELIDISYTYPNSSIKSLDGVNISIEKGTSVAIVGSTGAGKTTLVDLILGLLTPQDGEISVDDVMLKDSNLRSWQKNLGYVAQHIYLTDESVKKNIAFGIPDDLIDMDRVEQAAKIANIHDFIVTEMQNGYDTIVGERGVRLSGGQRQRIGIARALYTDPEVLVLDEATSSLDGMTEKAFIDALDEIARVKTLVIIAHRFNTIKGCDVIYVLEKGHIVAQGTYNELMDSSLHFQMLANEKK